MVYEHRVDDYPGMPSVGSRHLIAAVAAALISLCFHGGAVFVVSHVRIEPTTLDAARRPIPRRYEAFRVEESPPVDAATQDRILSELRTATGEPGLVLPRAVEDVAVAVEEAGLAPPALAAGDILGGDAGLVPAGAIPEREAWAPRQAILALEDQALDSGVVPPGRRVVPVVGRVERAPDVAMPVSGELVTRLVASGAPEARLVAPRRADIGAATVGGDVPASTGVPEPVIAALGPGGSSELFEETRGDVTPVRPIERLLTASISTYTSLRDLRYGYFRIEVQRVGADALPELPKDIVFVQDCSASMAEQRLYFCRQALVQCLDRLGPNDRFNIAGFKERTTFCFAEWQTPSATTLTNAIRFIDGLQAGGNTDIYASMKDLLALPRERGRPMIAVVVTDGLANTGLTDSSDIIGSFSKVNDGRLSVFAMGTVLGANEYLLDLLSYCNRGDAFAVTKGRWDIPQALTGIVDSVRRPVLANLKLRFGQDAPCEVYPVQTSNLYLDRPLVLYGRYRKGQPNVVFQAVGEAGTVLCDMVFNLPLEGEGAAAGDRDIRESWARQKIYHLIGQYTRDFDKGVLDELRATARAYDQDIPYRKTLF